MVPQNSRVQIREDRWVPTICSGCLSACGVKVHVVDGVAIKVEGMPDSSFGSRGGICAKSASSIQVLYDPNRLNYPVRRTNPEKGIGVDPKWQRISWDEAMEEIADKLGKIHKDNPNKLIVSKGVRQGQALSQGRLLGMFTEAYGTKNASFAGGGLYCGNSTHLLTGMNHCSWFLAPDFEYGNYTIFFGDVKGAGGDCFAMLARTRAEAVARGMKIVAFDPLCHITGMKATEWIPMLPGTDLIICLAIANVLVNDLGIYDKEYLKTKTDAPYLVQDDGRFIRDDRGEPLMWDLADGSAKNWRQPVRDPALEGSYEVQGIRCRPVFAILKEHLKQYTPERASQVSTAPAATIRRIAREFGENARIGSTIEIQGVKLPYRPVSAVQYRAGSGHSNGCHSQYAVDLLNQLMGAADVPGGCLGMGQGRSLGYPETNCPRFEAVAGKDGFIEMEIGPLFKEWPVHEPKLPETLTLTDLFTGCTIASPFPYAKDSEELYQKLGVNYRTEAIFESGCNIIMNVGDVEAVEAFLKSVPFLVAHEIFHNETTEGFADIVLPDVHGLEALSCLDHVMPPAVAPVGMLANAFHLRQPVVKPMYERRNWGEVIVDLVNRLGINKEWNRELNRFAGGWYGHADIFGQDEKCSWEEINDRFLKGMFGPQHGLEWFKEHGFITWPKKVEEAYWRWFVDGRAHISMEYLIHLKEALKPILDEREIKLDWEQYTPLISWFPPVIQKVEDPTCDLYCVSFTDSLHTGTWTHGIPWLAEVSDTSPYLYTLLLNTRTAKERGIKDRDVIYVENDHGHRLKGVAHTIEGIHPQCVAMAMGMGKWAKGQPIARGKGALNSLIMEVDLEHHCPISLNIESAAAVKIYKAEESR